jgi:hypothetical protein
MRALIFCFALICATSQAAPWIFDAPMRVSQESKAGVFMHLESAGRKNIAMSGGAVAVAWEDNRDGVSRCYVAIKGQGQAEFGTSVQISGLEEAVEPAIVGIGEGRFALAWEEAEKIWGRIIKINPAGKSADRGEILQLSLKPAMQASLSYSKQNGLTVVWSEQGKSFQQIKLARLRIPAQGQPHKTGVTVVDANAKGDQSYPSLAESGVRTVIAWEDRSGGYTRLFYAVSQTDNTFSIPQQLNESKWRGPEKGLGQGGTGVMRVAMAAYGRDGTAAVWADKRDFQSGYDVYGSFAADPNLIFGANEKVQDEFGDNFAQWHPAIAANQKGRIAVVWDDDRDGSPDVWLSWRNTDGWSADLAVPGASGPGVQSDPSITMDESGNLYLAWVEKSDLNSPSSIRYVFGRVVKKE